MAPHPLFRLVAGHPGLLAEHVEAYGELIGEELADAVAIWKTDLLLAIAALCLGSLSIVLAGVALMLWAALPAIAGPSPWVLWATPSVPFVIAMGCLGARGRSTKAPLSTLRAQWKADMDMLRESGVLNERAPS